MVRHVLEVFVAVQTCLLVVLLVVKGFVWVVIMFPVSVFYFVIRRQKILSKMSALQDEYQERAEVTVHTVSTFVSHMCAWRCRVFCPFSPFLLLSLQLQISLLLCTCIFCFLFPPCLPPPPPFLTQMMEAKLRSGEEQRKAILKKAEERK